MDIYKETKHNFYIQGMLCIENCASRVVAAAREVSGVISAEVDISKGRLQVITRSMDLGVLAMDVIHNIFAAGYDVSRVDKYSVATLNIRGMYCNHCSATILALLTGLPEVISASVSLELHMAFVLLSGDISQISTVIEAVSDVGYDAQLFRNDVRSIRIPLVESVRLGVLS